MESRESLQLNADEVHIWSASLFEDKNNTNYFYSILSEDERERANSFKFSRDQRRFTIARGVLRCLISNYLGQTPKSIEIIYGLWGKPCLSKDIPLHFNISHSGDHALYAVTRNHEVGIDLEYIDKNLELEDMALHIFSPAELTDWKNLPPQERVNAFFTRWVSKEAFLKASGKGWLEDIEDIKKIEFDSKKGSSKGSLNDEMPNIYCFECIPGYASALLVDGALLRPLHYSWSQSNLTSAGNSK